MPQINIIVTENGIFTSCFVAGTRKCSHPKIKNESDALAYALWLEKHGFESEAEDFLNRYCYRK